MMINSSSEPSATTLERIAFWAAYLATLYLAARILPTVASWLLAEIAAW